MKKFSGLFILVIAFIVFAGCTQPATTAPTTTVQTTVPTTTVPTAMPTTVPTTIITTESTPALVANVTYAPTTVPAVLVPQTKITTIHMINNTFVPNLLAVLPGTGVTFVNDDSVTHQVNSVGNTTGAFRSGDILHGGNFIDTVSENEGTYGFVDPHYPNMTGTIVVIKGNAVVGSSSGVQGNPSSP